MNEYFSICLGPLLTCLSQATLSKHFSTLLSLYWVQDVKNSLFGLFYWYHFISRSTWNITHFITWGSHVVRCTYLYSWTRPLLNVVFSRLTFFNRLMESQPWPLECTKYRMIDNSLKVLTNVKIWNSTFSIR